MVPQIQPFYRNKTVFITGGSGFLGRVTIEKLLRLTEVKRIFMLARPKKGVSIKDRIAAWNTDPVFSVLVKLNPKFSDRVTPIVGDCGLPDLGISVEDRKLLLNEVHIVLHCAATVRFDEPLHVALDINTRGTLLVVQLAKEMRRLETFVHVSTAFSNCIIQHINEDYYPENLTCSPDKVLELREMLESKLIDNMSPAFVKDYPNTYTFTKALAEQVVRKEASGLPACIFRPGLILASFKDPIPGWTDNLYGPISILLGVTVGVLRVTLLDKKIRAHIVPVDYCANMVLSTAWKTAVENVQRKKQTLLKDPPIYNYAASDQNPVNWIHFSKAVEDRRFDHPLEQMIWYPFLHTTSKPWLFELAIIFYHILPGHIIDILLRLRGQKPRLVKAYNKIHNHIRSIALFAVTNWTFAMNNTDRLIECMTSEDRKLFECSMNGLSWDEYFGVALFGMREYLGKEKPTEESFQKARKVMKRFYLYHRIVLGVAALTIIALIWLTIRLISGFLY